MHCNECGLPDQECGLCRSLLYLVRPSPLHYRLRMKLYRFRYSPYARKVQLLLDLLGKRYELIEVPYANRSELAALTGGYIHVPVLVTDDQGRHCRGADANGLLLATPSATETTMRCLN